MNHIIRVRFHRSTGSRAELRQWTRAEGAGIGERGGAGFQHEYHRKERKVRKDKYICFINCDLLMSGAALKEEPDWTG